MTRQDLIDMYAVLVRSGLDDARKLVSLAAKIEAAIKELDKQA